MRAAVVESFGGPDALVSGQVADPEPRPGWLTVRLRAAALNWHDVLVREGRYGSPLPHVIGSDGAGTCVETGEHVVVLPSIGWGQREEAPEPGWSILGDQLRGTYAEFVQVPADCVAPKPADWTWSQAAAVPLVGLTCFRALATRGRVRPGEWVLILGAGGGVATMAVGVARALGAVPCVTSSSPEKIEQARAMGAEGGVEYTNPQWIQRARELTPDGRGFDLVLDSVGTLADSLAALRPGGRVVVLGASRAESVDLSLRPFYFGQHSIIGTTMGSPADFRGLLDLISQGALPPPPIAAHFPLSEAAQAHHFLESGRGFGKVVLDISDGLTEGG